MIQTEELKLNLPLYKRIKYDDDKNEIILPPQLSKLGIPLDVLIDNYNIIRTNIHELTDIAKERLRVLITKYPNVPYHVILLAYNCREWQKLDLERTVDELLDAVIEPIEILSSTTRINIGKDIYDFLDIQNKHITVWTNKEITNGFYHLWNTYGIRHYHVPKTFKQAKELLLFNLQRTITSKKGKRIYYGLACDSPSFCENELSILERIQYAFGETFDIPDNSLDFVLEDMLPEKRCPLTFFRISENDLEEERRQNESNNNIYTNYVLSESIHVNKMNEAGRIPIIKIPNGEAIKINVEQWDNKRGYTIDQSIIGMVFGNIDKELGREPDIDMKYESMMDVNANDENYKRLLALLLDPNLQITLDDQLDVKGKIDIAAYAESLYVFSLVVNFIKAYDGEKRTFNVACDGFPILNDVFSRIKDIKVLSQNEVLSADIIIDDEEIDEWNPLPEKFYIKIVDRVPKIDVNVFALPIISQDGNVKVLSAVLLQSKMNEIKNILSPQCDYKIINKNLRHMNSQRLEDTGLYLDSGKRYRISTSHLYQHALYGASSLQGRGTMRATVSENETIYYAIGINEPSRCALKQLCGQLEYDGDLPYLIPADLIENRDATFSAEELLSYCQKLFLKQNVKYEVLNDYGSGNYYNVWMLDLENENAKLNQFDKQILDKTPTDRISNWKIDLVTDARFPDVGGDLGIAINSIFFSDKLMPIEDFKKLINNIKIHNKNVAINLPVYSKEASLVYPIDNRLMSDKNGNHVISLGSYEPVLMYNKDSEHIKYLDENFKVYYPSIYDLIVTSKIFGKPCSMETIVKAYHISEFLPVYSCF